MGNIIIILSTILLLLILLWRSITNNKVIRSIIQNTIKEINKTYLEIFKSNRFFNKLFHGGIIIMSEFFGLTFTFATINKYVHTSLPISFEIALKILLILILFGVIHYAIGYVLLITTRIQKFIYKVSDQNLKIDFLLSYFIIVTFFTVMVIFPEHFKKSAVFGLISLFICFILNLRVLIKIMIAPTSLKSIHEDDTSFSRIIIASILILTMLLLNLFLAVCFVNSLGTNVYINATDNFDLFYYTVITFTTIGYGDIIPNTLLAKGLAIIISITSVICLTIFLSKILSTENKENEPSNT